MQVLTLCECKRTHQVLRGSMGVWGRWADQVDVAAVNKEEDEERKRQGQERAGRKTEGRIVVALGCGGRMAEEEEEEEEQKQGCRRGGAAVVGGSWLSRKPRIPPGSRPGTQNPKLERSDAEA